MKNDDDILIQWKDYFQNDKEILKELQKLESVKLSETDFLSNFLVINNKIVAKRGIGLNKINALSLRALVYFFIQENFTNDDKLFFVSYDGNLEIKKMIKSLNFLNLQNYGLITLNDYKSIDKKMINEIFKKIKLSGGMYIQESIYESDLFEIYFFNKDGELINHEIISNFVKNIYWKNFFDIPLKNDEEILFIDYEPLIKMFVKKVVSLYTKKNNTNKTKVVISNHNNFACEIVSKILGNLDFSYVVNDNPSRKNIFAFKKINDKKIRKIFFDEINFAKRKKANVLISFDKSGSQLFCFLKIKNNFVFINENIISLMINHHFFNNLILNKIKLTNFYIQSNNLLSNNMQNLVQKFSIPFELKNDLELDKHSYMLYYWNSYYQFAFGEKHNSFFTIYHIFVKLLEIINIYNSQFGSVQGHLRDLKIMYGNTNQKIFITNVLKSKLINKIKEIQKNDNKILLDEFGIKSIKMYNDIEHIDQFLYDEVLIFNLELNDNSSLMIKWNSILNKIIFIIRDENKKNTLQKFIDLFKKNKQNIIHYLLND